LNAHQTASGRRIVLATFGSLGDLHPYLALALELQQRGHRPVIATSGHWEAKVEGLGLDFHAVRPDAPPERDQAAFMKRVLHPSKGPQVVIKLMLDHLSESFEDMIAIVNSADLLVSHPLTFTVPLLAETRGIPWISTVLAPLSFFSAEDPPVLGAAPWFEALSRLGPRFHRLVYRVVRRATRPWVRPWEEFRRELGLKPAGHPLFEAQHAPALVLALFSRALAKPQSDWPARTEVTGFCFFDQDEAGSMTKDLERFLAGGPPPVVFTLGSTAVWAAERFYDQAIEAVTRLGQRAVLLVGPAGINDLPDPLPASVFAAPYAPYSELFPRCAAIVHPGGVGTTGQAMRAGRPMIVMPYGFDQFDNAARIARLGIGRTLPKRRLSAKRLAEALDAVLRDRTMAERAAEVGRQVARENGAKTAADAIETHALRLDGTGSVT